VIDAAINVGSLVKMLYASVLAGIGVAVIFSIVILGMVRSSDMRRADRDGAATAYAVLAGVALVLATAVVVYGLVLVAHKG
jgi:hypothetical protein